MVAAARRRLPDRPARAAAHRHLLRDDHGGHRRDLLLRRVQSAVGVDRRRERLARRADAELRPRLHDAAVHLRLVALSVPRVLLFRRHRDRAAHRALAGRRGARRDPREPAARRRRRPQRARPTSSPPSSSPPPTPASPAACSACCRASCRRTPSCSTPRASSIMQTAIGGRGTLFGPLVGAARLAVPAGLPAGDAEARRGLEAGAGPGLRAARVLPAPGHHRRHRATCTRCVRGSGRARRRAGAAEAAPRRSGGAASRRCRARHARRAATVQRARSCRPRASPSATAASSPTRTSTSRVQRGRAARHHRPERRRQDDLLQDADLRGAADRRARSSSRAATSPA